MIRAVSLLWFLVLGASVFAENRVRLLPSPTEDVQARLQVIKESDVIYLTTYIFKEDQAGLAQLALLRRAPRQGKKVRVLWDGFSGNISPAMIRHLQAEGIEIKIYRPPPFSRAAPLSNLFRPREWFRRTHDKLFIGFKEDGGGPVQVVAGSRNQKDASFGLGERPNREYGIHVEGKAAEEAKAYYERVWDSAGARLPRPLPTRRASVEKAAARLDRVEREMVGWPAFVARRELGHREPGLEAPQVTFIHDNLETLRGTAEPIVKLIDSARSKVVITTPYLIPPPEIEKALERAAKRGVKVTILTNSRASTNVPLAQAGYENALPRLLKLGVEIREFTTPHLIHHKIVAVDGTRTFVGSYNLDRRSADSQLESGFIVEGTAFHDWVTQNLERQLALSAPVTAPPPPGSCRWGFLRMAARPLESVL